MEDEIDFNKIPLEDRCVHKVWKARLSAYNEITVLFKQLDEKSPEWSKYLGLVKKFAADSNAVAQEKGLEAVLAFVENCGHAGKTVGEVMAGIVNKCLPAQKAKTKELAVQITLMYIEIEKVEQVMEELIRGMDQKNPKAVAACVAAATEALKQFGSKIISIKPLVKKMPALLEDRSGLVRDEGKTMVVEMYRWAGDALKPQLNSLKPVQVTELESEFGKIKGTKAVPIRYIRSQQQLQARVAANAASGDADDEECEEAEEAPEIDPYELMEPVDILSKLPKDFYEKVEAKKWQERKEAVECLEQLVQNPKLESGDYGDLVRALKKIISKDTNVMVVAVAGKCLAGLASGLKRRFQPYAGSCIPCILEKFREKKQNVVSALRDAIDAIYKSTTIEAIQEDCVAALENKNPSVKSETAAFLARCFTKCTSVMLNKKLLKVYTTALVKTLNESDPTVRDNSAEALGTAMKVVGEKIMMPFLDVDNLKITKIKECCEKAVIVAKPSGPSRPKTAPPKVISEEAAAPATSSKDASSAPATGGPKVNRRPATTGGAAAKKAAGKKVASAPAGKGKAAGKKQDTAQTEKPLTSEEVDEKAAALFSDDVISGLADANWKTRVTAVEQFIQTVRSMEREEIPTQVLIRTLNKKPGLKDTNFQVLKLRLEAAKLLAENSNFTKTSAEYCLTDIVEKLADAKNGGLAGEVLTSIAEAVKLDFVASETMYFAFGQRNPKVQQEAMNWVSNAIGEFGFMVRPKPILENIKKALAASNPAVRTSAITLLGTLYLYMGPSVRVLFEDEKSILLQQIDAEFEKYVGQTPPAPTRGVANTANEEEGDDDDERMSAEAQNIQDLMPRVDISSHLTESLITELGDKNWKVRNEALQKLSNIVNETKFITPNLGELPPVFNARLVDSNKNIALTAMNLCQTMGVAMGSQCKQHVRTLFPGMLQALGDSKSSMRTAAASCMNTWGEQCGYKDFFDGEMIADALKAGNPFLKTDLLAWLAEKLPEVKSVPKEELQACLPHAFAALEDRSADVRKNAQDVILPFMLHLGYESMLKASSKLKPGSRSQVAMLLEKNRAYLPAKPTPKPKNAAGGGSNKPVSVRPAAFSDSNKDEQPKLVMGRGKSAGKAVKGKVGAAANKPGGRRKDEEPDTSPLLQVNNMKNQRVLDEQKLRVLKWNFTTPREEFVEVLRDQMTNAGVNKNLMTNMFHSDFKYHLKTIEALNEDLSSNPDALVANLDLILKWITLRFFDTNPSVLIKGLEYLQCSFGVLIQEEYNMLETEASSFIPYLILKDLILQQWQSSWDLETRNKLHAVKPTVQTWKSSSCPSRPEEVALTCMQINHCRFTCSHLFLNMDPPFFFVVRHQLVTATMVAVATEIDRTKKKKYSFADKVGDPKDSVRSNVRQLFNQISLVYPASKLFAYIMEGLKSKNARQRTECLDELGSLIENYGMGVTQQSPAALKEIARQISDRDNSVRNAALNCILQVYFLEGERVYKMIGQISDKDNSLLEERIKRAHKNRPQPNKRTLPQVPMRQHKVVRQGSESAIHKMSPKQHEEMDIFNRVREPSQSDVSEPEDPPLQAAAQDTVSPQLRTSANRGTSLQGTPPKPRPVSGPFRLDYEMLEEIEGDAFDLKAPKLVEYDLEEILNEKPMELPETALRPPSPATKVLSNCVESNQIIDLVMSQIPSPDLITSVHALAQMDELLKSDKAYLLLTRVDQLVVAIAMQLRLIHRNQGDAESSTPKELILKGYRYLFVTLMALYHNRNLARRASQDVLRDLVYMLLTILLDRRVEELEEGSYLIKTINVLVLRVIERSDHTNITCALIKSLHDCVGSPNTSPRFMELIMKCLWKVIRLLPDWEEDVNFDVVLYDLHLFLKEYPRATWKERQSDLPLRTVKTILYSMTKVKGNKILSHLGKIENLKESELEAYLMKIIKNELKKDEGRPSRKDGKSPRRLSKSTHELLSDIFKKIGSKEHTKEGLALLYDFKQQHPEADIEPFLRKSSQFFQDYIERGLKGIDRDRKRVGDQGHGMLDSAALTPCSESGEGGAPYLDRLHAMRARFGGVGMQDNLKTGVSGSVEDLLNDGNSRSAMYYLERLRTLQAQAGLTPTHLDQKLKPQHIQTDNRINADENSNSNQDAEELVCTMPRSRSTDGISSNTSDVEALRKRLEKVKSAAR